MRARKGRGTRKPRRFSHTPSHTRTLTHTHSHTHSLTLSHTHSHTLSHTHTHTHSHTLSHTGVELRVQRVLGILQQRRDHVFQPRRQQLPVTISYARGTPVTTSCRPWLSPATVCPTPGSGWGFDEVRIQLPALVTAQTLSTPRAREFYIDNLLVRIHCIIAMIRWTGLAPWEFEFPFPGDGLEITRRRRSGFRVAGCGLRASGFGLRASGFGFQVLGLWFRV